MKSLPALVVLGNGPSLDDDLSWVRACRQELFLFGCNYLAVHREMRFTYYCLADPVFYTPPLGDAAREVWHRLRRQPQVSPEVFVPWRPTKPVMNFREVQPLQVSRFVANPFYDGPFAWLLCGLGVVGLPRCTALSYMLLIGLRRGYRRIFVVGAAHDQFLQIRPGSPGIGFAHCYGNPVPDPRTPSSVSGALREQSDNFRSHELVARYARHVGATIINVTEGSMIDAYHTREKFRTVKDYDFLSGGATPRRRQ